jgi:hypothetical protein
MSAARRIGSIPLWLFLDVSLYAESYSGGLQFAILHIWLWIAAAVAKGWIKKQPDGQTYCITPAGDSELRAVIPVKR